MSTESSNAFELRDVSRAFVEGQLKRQVLNRVSLEIRSGEFVAITGASGSGKTTLLSILGLLDRAYEGSLRVFGQDVRDLTERALGTFRNERMGFVFQAFHLIPDASVLENVMAASLFSKSDRIDESAASRALERVGLVDRTASLPRHLSGGQRQRVAFARAWAQNPDVLLCDEPTGNLDTHTGNDIVSLLRDFHHEKKTVVVVTHSETLAAAATRRIVLADGVIEVSR